MGSRTSTGNADKSQHLSSSRAWRVSCEAEHFATVFTFINAFAGVQLVLLPYRNYFHWVQETP